MSADVQMSSATNEVEFPYRALSSAAIASVVFAVLALTGFFSGPASVWRCLARFLDYLAIAK